MHCFKVLSHLANMSVRCGDSDDAFVNVHVGCCLPRDLFSSFYATSIV